MFLPAKKTINQQPSFRNAGEIVKEQSSLLGMVKLKALDGINIVNEHNSHVKA